MIEIDEFLKEKLRANVADDFLFTEQFGSYMINFTKAELKQWFDEWTEQAEDNYRERTKRF